MITWRVLLVPAVLAFVFFGTVAATDSASVNISVRDAKTSGPVEAVVLLEGPVTVGDSSDIDGRVTFESMPAGTYTLTVRRNGYEAASRRFDVISGDSVSIEVRLAPIGKLRVIGTVVVHASHAAARDVLDDSSASRILHTDLIDALSNVPGLDLVRSRTGAPSASIALYGHDPSATAVNLDGVPLSLPGSAFNVGLFNTDLLNRLSIDYGPSGSAQGGNVTFSLLSPTVPWQTKFEGTVGSFGRAYAAFSETGTLGKLAIAFKHSARTLTSPLSGAQYVDWSGLNYSHAGDSYTQGSAFKVRYAASNRQSISFTLLNSSLYQDGLCTLFTTITPCGYGPNNFYTGQFRLFSLADAFAIGDSTWTVAHYAYSSGTDQNFQNQAFAKMPIPAAGSSNNRASGFSLEGEIPIGERDHLYARMTQTTVTSTFISSTPGFLQQSERSAHYGSTTLTDTHRVNKRLRLIARGDFTSISDTKGTLSGQLAAIDEFSPEKAASVSAYVGRGVNPDASTTPISAPGQLVYNCASHSAIGAAPGSNSSSNSLQAVSATWDDSKPRSELHLQAYAQSERSASLSTLVNALAFPGSFFPSDYFFDAARFNNLPTICGTSALLTPAQIYFETTLSGVDMVFSGIRAQWRAPLGKALTMESTAALNRVAAWSSNPALRYPLTVFQPGAQLFGVPLLSAELSLAYKNDQPRATAFYLGEYYTGYGNGSSLPPNVVTNFAAVKPMQRGVLSFLVQNVFNARAGNFASNASATPLILNNGEQLVPASVPNAPRTVSISYNVGVGRDLVDESSVSQSFAAAPSAESLIPGYLVVKWPTSRPDNAFRRNAGTACGSTQRATAEPILTTVEAIVNGLDRNNNNTTTLKAIASLKNLGIEAAYTRLRDTYAITLFTTKITVTEALVACSFLHVGTQDDAKSANLPFPPKQSLTSASFYYAPQIGLYFIQVPPEKGLAQKFRTYRLPSAPPQLPFTLSNETQCEPELRPIAEKLLTELAMFFKTPEPRSAKTASWDITRHESAAGSWYELHSDEIGAATAMVNCAHVASASLSELAALKYSGAQQPSFNYAKALGIYITTQK